MAGRTRISLSGGQSQTHRQFDANAAIEIKTAGDETIKIGRTLSADGKEVQLHCFSSGKEQKDAAIARRLCARLEKGLEKLAAGLAKPRAEKRIDKLNERIALGMNVPC